MYIYIRVGVFACEKRNKNIKEGNKKTTAFETTVVLCTGNSIQADYETKSGMAHSRTQMEERGCNFGRILPDNTPEFMLRVS